MPVEATLAKRIDSCIYVAHFCRPVSQVTLHHDGLRATRQDTVRENSQSKRRGAIISDLPTNCDRVFTLIANSFSEPVERSLLLSRSLALCLSLCLSFLLFCFPEVMMISLGPEAARKLLNFVNASPTPFHAVHAASTRLEEAGFRKVGMNNNSTMLPLFIGWDCVFPRY